MKTCTFPELGINEIISCMKDMEIQVSESDILKPTSQRIIDIYTLFAEQIMGLNSLPFIMDSEIMQDSISLLGIHRQLLKLFTKIGVEEFNLSDLLKPETKRIKHVLSAAINFCKFREDRLQIFEQCTLKSDELIDRQAKLTTTISKLAEKVNSKKFVLLM